MAEVRGLGPQAAPYSLPDQHHGGKYPLCDDNSQTLISPTPALNPSHVHPTACLTSPQMHNVQFTECQSSGQLFLMPQLTHLGVTFDSALLSRTLHPIYQETAGATFKIYAEPEHFSCSQPPLSSRWRAGVSVLHLSLLSTRQP